MTQERAPLGTVLSHVALPILMGLIMAVAYLGGFHKPEPHDLPLAVVGSTAEAQPVADGMQQALGDKADVEVLPNTDVATDKIRHLDLTAAYVPGSKSATLLVSTMASDAAKSAATQMVSPVAAKQGVPLVTRDVTGVPASDPVGQNGFFFLVALTVGSYASAIAIGAAGASRKLRDRVGIALGAAIVISTVGLLIARGFYGMFPGDLPAVWGLSLLYTAAVLLIGVGLHPILGRFSTITYAAIFVALNFTTSGGVFPTTLQPAFFGLLHHFWIGSGFVESLRRVLYFPDVSIGGPLAILLGWLVLGVACIGLAHLVERRRTTAAARLDHGRLTERVEEELEEDVAV